jgi:ADP-heptose:LPS heptosyltransferase
MSKRTIILRHHRAAGDILVMTAVVRDLYKAYSDTVDIGVETPFPEIWENNPYIIKLKDKRLGASVYNLSYGDGIRKAGREPIHFMQAFYDDFEKRSGMKLSLTEPKPDIHLSEFELSKRAVEGRYWVVLSGGKADFTTKHPRFFDIQDSVDVLRSMGVKFVQVGASGGKPASLHRTIEGAIDLRGKTSLRDLMSLIHHSDGVICTITMAMHMAAALQKPCVVLAGGREEWWWEGYVRENPAFKGLNVNVPHKYLHTMGLLDCCRGPRACWKNKVLKSEGDKSYCSYPHLEPEGQTVPLCQHMIGASKITEAVLYYYLTGTLLPLPDWSLNNMLPSVDKPTSLVLPDGRKVKVEVTIDDYNDITSKRKIELPILKPAKVHEPLVVNLVETSPLASLMDHEEIGGQVTLCLLMYGKFFDMHKRCLSALARVPSSRLDLRVYLNQACDETIAMAEEMHKNKQISVLYRSESNKFKYPCMREMFHDKNNPITNKWVIWFDDDTMADVDNHWLDKLCQAVITNVKSDPSVGMLGARYFFSMNQEHLSWIRTGSWFKGVSFRDKAGNAAPNGFKIHFASGSCWAIKRECITECDIPDTRLRHNGGDVCIGEQLWQGGWHLKNWNNDKRIVLWSSVARRGYAESIFGI